MRYVALLSVGLLTFVPHGAGVAQQPRIPIHRGQLVRLTAPDLGFNRQTAVFRMLRNDTLVVAVRDSAVHCPVASVTGLDVSRGQRSWAGVGALFGAVGGAGLGVVLGVGVLAPLCEEDRGTCTGATVGGGALLGAFLGGLAAQGVKSERWEEVPLERLRMTVARHLDGLALGLSVRF